MEATIIIKDNNEKDYTIINDIIIYISFLHELDKIKFILNN